MIPQNKAMTIGGWIVTGLVSTMLIGPSGGSKLLRAEQAVEGMKKFGYPDNTLMPLGITEIACTLLYLVPQTSVLGAVLLTGYLGGATATHVRAADPFGNIITPVVIGVLVWLGLWLRCRRVRDLLPLRLSTPSAAPKPAF